MVIFQDGKKYQAYEYTRTEDMVVDIANRSKMFFGEDAIYIDAKRHFESSALEEIKPDGFLFHLPEKNIPQFSLVKIEMSSHDFYGQIFPTITKFFVWFENFESQLELGRKLFSLIDSSVDLRNEFGRLTREKVTDGFIRSVMENSHNILLITDAERSEFSETMETYTDTWGKMVQIFILKKYTSKEESIYFLDQGKKITDYSYTGHAADSDASNDIPQSGPSPMGVTEKPPEKGLTEAILKRQVSLTKIGGKGTQLGETWIGWENSPPKENEPYRVHLGEGKVLRTSPVQLITETEDEFCIMTENSLYEVKILETK